MKLPLVIAHRGASGYRPENTLEAFHLGIEQQADGIEFDLVTTSDQELIIRHENTLSGTTDIEAHPEFADRKRYGVVDGQEVFDWFTEDLTFAEISTLRAIERLPDIRPGSAKFDGEFTIPTFSELLESRFIDEKKLVVELKQGTHISTLTTSMPELVVADIAKADLANRKVEVYLESFDFELLVQAKHQMESKKLYASYLFALEGKARGELDLVKLAEVVDGLTISLEMLFADENWVADCHGLGLEVWAYTARAEQAETSIEEYYEKIIDTGVDAIFADQPDLLRRVLANRSGSAYDY